MTKKRLRKKREKEEKGKANAFQSFIQMFFEKEREGDNLFRINADLAERLVFLAKQTDQGQLVLTLILAELFRQQRENNLPEMVKHAGDYGDPVYHLLQVISEFAGREHAEKIVEMLGWEPIFQDRSLSNEIVKILGKLGNTSVISLLDDLLRIINIRKCYKESEVGESQLEKDKKKILKAITVLKRGEGGNPLIATTEMCTLGGGGCETVAL